MELNKRYDITLSAGFYDIEYENNVKCIEIMPKSYRIERKDGTTRLIRRGCILQLKKFKEDEVPINETPPPILPPPPLVSPLPEKKKVLPYEISCIAFGILLYVALLLLDARIMIIWGALVCVGLAILSALIALKQEKLAKRRQRRQPGEDQQEDKPDRNSVSQAAIAIKAVAGTYLLVFSIVGIVVATAFVIGGSLGIAEYIILEIVLTLLSWCGLKLLKVTTIPAPIALAQVSITMFVAIIGLLANKSPKQAVLLMIAAFFIIGIPLTIYLENKKNAQQTEYTPAADAEPGDPPPKKSVPPGYSHRETS